MMEEISSAISELKRVDHMIYVSLKYTRTVDVLKNTIERIIAAIDFGVLALLENLKNKKKIKEYPGNPGQRVELLNRTYPDDKLLAEYLEFYLLLRKISKAPYTRREEYRRHVTMIAQLEPQTIVEVNIDNLEERFKRTKEFIDYVIGIVEGKKDD